MTIIFKGAQSPAQLRQLRAKPVAVHLGFATAQVSSPVILGQGDIHSRVHSGTLSSRDDQGPRK